MNQKILLAILVMVSITCPVSGEQPRPSEDFLRQKAELQKKKQERLKDAKFFKDNRIREYLEDEAAALYRLDLDDLLTDEVKRQEERNQLEKQKKEKEKKDTKSIAPQGKVVTPRSDGLGPKGPKRDGSFLDCRNYEPRAHPVV